MNHEQVDTLAQVNLSYNPPHSLGLDRRLNMERLATLLAEHPPSREKLNWGMVVSFGTACTVDVVLESVAECSSSPHALKASSVERFFHHKGGWILPGWLSYAQSLQLRVPQLPEPQANPALFEAEAAILGQNTTTAMEQGYHQHYWYGVRGVLAEAHRLAERTSPPMIVLTGGDAHLASHALGWTGSRGETGRTQSNIREQDTELELGFGFGFGFGLSHGFVFRVHG
jgi:pantothenate kinase type III